MNGAEIIIKFFVCRKKKEKKTHRINSLSLKDKFSKI